VAKIDALFQKLIKEGGSDLHLKQGAKPRLRVNGHLVEIADEPELTDESLAGMMKEIAEEEQWKKYGRIGDLDFAYALAGVARFRANYFRHASGHGAIFRIIPSNILTLEDLDMPATLNQFAHIPSGLVLVTGPTGSGKSTTLAAIINDINRNYAKKIITIEEPVEFIHNNKKCLISHREVGLDTLSFTSGLKTAIKSDVNIILVGEMRDQETIRLALNAAEMGILVFGTLHTNSAGKTVDRIIDVFPANQKGQIRTTLANVLKGVVSQQLLRSADGLRRWVAYEILLRTMALGAIIQAGETVKITTEIQLNRQNGTILMDDCLFEMVQSGRVTKEEALKKALDKSRFM
jgi:twitching motility protein PilT